MSETTPTLSYDDTIHSVIFGFRDRLQALRLIAKIQLTHAKENEAAELRRLQSEIDEAGAKIKGDASSPQVGRVVNDFYDIYRSIHLLTKFPQEEILAETIFTSIFSALDAFIGQLLRTIYKFNTTLLAARNVTLKDVLNQSKEEIVEAAIDRSVESLLRNSYSTIFDRLAKRFNVDTLKGLENWPKFIECSQRRHLLVHCGGLVSRQYITVCKSHKAEIPADISLNSQLRISEQYLRDTINVVAEVGLKLGQVLWRKPRESSVSHADGALGQLIYDFLKTEQWDLALRMGEFGQDCAKRSYRKPRNERSVKIILLNYAQAAKWSGDEGGALKIIEGADWSGSGLEFRLCVACLKGNWDEAAELMRQIGKNSRELPIAAYDAWPIFRDFRETPQFLAMFETVFGVQFADKPRGAVGDQPLDPPEQHPEGESHDAN